MVLSEPLVSTVSAESRKRTSSFSSARPKKTPRLGMGALCRTESFVSLVKAPETAVGKTPEAGPEYSRSLRCYKDQRRRQKAIIRSLYSDDPSPMTPPVHVRTTSPLSPHYPSFLPARPVFPRSKVEPDLYRKAITTRMKGSEVGQRICSMGARLALSIMAATDDLERLVAEREDVAMDDAPALSNSWVLIPNDDWEMIE
ncbi:hypothetical protein C8J56DRAFT_864246 [Mycena floridula]|nr:hypothetical protein C8J56DRAFT_864246 [Mycena floridula]